MQSILGDQLSAAELREILTRRQAEIRAHIDHEAARLARVEARLLTIEDEARTPVDGVIVKSLPQVRVAELACTAAGYEPEAITPVIQPLYCDLWELMAAAGVSVADRAIAYYQDTSDDNGAVVVHAAVPVVTEVDADCGFRVTTLPEIDRAAVIIHHGRMDDVLVTGQALARWIDANGYRSAGYAREVTLEWSADPDTWITELQQPITATGG